jgi:hypothetical protein
MIFNHPKKRRLGDGGKNYGIDKIEWQREHYHISSQSAAQSGATKKAFFLYCVDSISKVVQHFRHQSTCFPPSTK